MPPTKRPTTREGRRDLQALAQAKRLPRAEAKPAPRPARPKREALPPEEAQRREHIRLKGVAEKRRLERQPRVKARLDALAERREAEAAKPRQPRGRPFKCRKLVEGTYKNGKIPGTRVFRREHTPLEKLGAVQIVEDCLTAQGVEKWRDLRWEDKQKIEKQLNVSMRTLAKYRETMAEWFPKLTALRNYQFKTSDAGRGQARPASGNLQIPRQTGEYRSTTYGAA